MDWAFTPFRKAPFASTAVSRPSRSWPRLQDVLDEPDAVGGGEKIALWKRIDGIAWRVILKASTGGEIFVNSVHRGRDAVLERLMREGGLAVGRLALLLGTGPVIRGSTARQIYVNLRREPTSGEREPVKHSLLVAGLLSLSASSVFAQGDRYQMVPLPSSGNVASMVLILDTQEGHMWRWVDITTTPSSKGGFTVRYVGKIAPGSKTGDIVIQQPQ